MNSFRKFTAALAALAVSMTSVFTFSVAVAATTFTDASSIASWASASVTSLSDSGVLSGRPDGSFDPQGQLNRAEVAKVAVGAAGLTEDTTGAPHFNDVAASDWFYSFVETLYNNGVVGGINSGALDSNGLATYNPAGTLNRAEGSKILVDAFDLETSYAGTPPNFPDVASSAWFYDYVETAYAHGIVNGYSNGNFGPSDAITREQIAVIAQSSVDEAADSSKRRSDYTAGAASAVVPNIIPPVVPTSDGDLTVALSASSPDAQTFPVGAASTAVAAFDITASSDDVVISNLVVTRTGVGNDAGWTLYFYDGDNRLTSGKTINSTTHAATFTGLNATIAAGTTKTLTLKADTSSAGAGDSFFEITSADSITSNAQSVGGTFPVKSTKQEINTSVTAGTITVEKTGSVTDPEVGADNITIGKFKLTTANEAGLVSQIALLVDGTISATDVQNAKLYQGDTLLASTTAVNSKDLLVFNFDIPYEIAKGDSRNFEVKADLNTGRNTDTVKIYLDESTDLVSIGGTYGFGMAVTYGDYDNGSDDGTDASHSTLQGGDITISSSGPAATDVAINGDDITVMDFTITSVSEVTFKKFAISLTAGTGDAIDTSLTAAGGAYGLIASTTDSGTISAYTDIKIINKDTGATLMGPIDSNSMYAASTFSGDTVDGDTDADGFYYFSDEFTMASGEELNLALVLDVSNNTGLSGDTLIARLEIETSYPEVKDINNKTLTVSSSIVPGSDIVGKTMTIAAPSLTIARSSTPVSDTYVKGVQDVCFVGASFAAGDASDIKITEIKVDGGSDENGTGWTQDAANVKNYVGSVELWDGNTKIAGPESVQTDGTATFDNISYTVEAGATKLLKVCGDISSSIASGNRGVAFAIASAGNITAEDEDGNTVTATGTANIVASTPNVIMTVSQGGSLTVAVDADTAKENIVVAGTSDVEISKFKFTSTDEAFLVTKLSINNRQDGIVADTDLGEYDNNVISIKLSYTNSAGATETKTGFLTNGTANFSGLDLLVEKDDDTTLAVSATLNTISAGATAAEFVDFNIAFNDFEAVAQGSGETYNGSQIDAVASATNTLSFGTITWTDSGTDLDTAVTAVAPGASTSMSLDGDLDLPAGTLLCTDTGHTTCATEAADAEIYVLTTALNNTGSAAAAVVATLLDNGVAANRTGNAASASGDNVLYALPGQGYLTNANQMVVYESKPTIALSSSSPSGTRSQSASDGILLFTLSADSQEKIQIRTGKEYATCASDGGVTITDATDTTTSADGSSCQATLLGTTGDNISFDSSGDDLSGYAYVSFWIYWHDTTGTATLAVTDLNVATGTTVALEDQVTALAATNVVGGGSTFTEDLWYFVKDVAMPTGTASADYLNIESSTIGNIIDEDIIRIDRVIVYNEKVEVDLASDASMDAATDDTQVAYLKEGGSTVATGYIDLTSDSAGTVTFIPVSGTDTDIEISKGTSKTFTVETSTSTLITGAGGTDDLLTPSIDLGSSASGTVTAGDLWWQETNATAKWLGHVDNSTLNGNTLKY